MYNNTPSAPPLYQSDPPPYDSAAYNQGGSLNPPVYGQNPNQGYPPQNGGYPMNQNPPYAQQPTCTVYAQPPNQGYPPPNFGQSMFQPQPFPPTNSYGAPMAANTTIPPSSQSYVLPPAQAPQQMMLPPTGVVPQTMAPIGKITSSPPPNKRLIDCSDIGASTMKKLNSEKHFGVTHITFRYNDLTHVINLSQFDELMWLDVSENEISTLRELNSYTVMSLNARLNELNSCKGLELCPNLRFLNLSENNITDIRALHSCRLLQQINLKKNELEEEQDVMELSKLTFLTLLDVSINNFDQRQKDMIRNHFRINNPRVEVIL